MSLRLHLIHTGLTYHGFASAGRDGEASMIHHGLAMIGAVARQAGHDVRLTNLRACSGWEDLRRRLDEHDPQVVGLTMMSCDYNHVLEAARMAKERDPRVVTVVGGPHPSLMPEELEPRVEVDVIFQGEGEVTFPQVLAQIERGQRPERVIRGEVPDLNQVPFVARDLFWHPEIPQVTLYFPKPYVTIIAGRGCRYNCAFCQPAERMIFGRNVRRRSVDNVLEELRILRREVRYRSLTIHDDCLTEDPDWVSAFCDGLRAERLAVPFVAQSRADLICKNPDLIAKMRRVGLRCLMIGFESGSDRVLKFLRKGVTLEKNLAAARICDELGIRIWANYMLGIPTETPDEVRATVDMIKTIRPAFCSAAYYTPHPGSDLYQYCRDHDLSLIRSHESYSRHPTEPKIRGVDYTFLEEMLAETHTARRLHPIEKLSKAARRLHVPAAVRRAAQKLISPR